jgi:hypothetical protein
MILAQADAAGLIDWTVSVDSTINRAHQHGTNLTRYIYWVPDRRGHGRWTRYDFLALSLMIRGVLSPGSQALVDR